MRALSTRGPLAARHPHSRRPPAAKEFLGALKIEQADDDTERPEAMARQIAELEAELG